MSFNEKMFYQAVCDKCGARDEGDDYQWWYDKGQALESVTDGADWFERTRLLKTIEPDADHKFPRYIYETVELFCYDCRSCDVCGVKPAYVGDEENHLVCEDHEDYEFATKETP